jgi:hypothetical protein
VNFDDIDLCAVKEMACVKFSIVPTCTIPLAIIKERKISLG